MGRRISQPLQAYRELVRLKLGFMMVGLQTRPLRERMPGNARGARFIAFANDDFTGTVLSVGESLTLGYAGTANFNSSALNVQTLTVSNGELDSGDVTVSNQLVWQAGTIAGSGTLTVEDNGGTATNLLLSDGAIGSAGVWTLDGEDPRQPGTGNPESIDGEPRRTFQLFERRHVRQCGDAYGRERQQCVIPTSRFDCCEIREQGNCSSMRWEAITC